MKRVSPFLVIAAWVLLIEGAGSLAAAATFTDMLGRTLSVPEPPRRIVSLVPSVTEVLYSLGVEDRLVGVTTFCTYPEAATSKPLVGGYADPSLEAIIARKPDLLIVSAAVTTPTQVARYEKLGVPTFVIHATGLPSTIQMLRQIGEVTGVPEAGEELAQRLEAMRDRVRSAVAKRSRPTVLTAVMVTQLTVAGPKTLIHDLLEAAGGNNVVPDTPVRYPTWGPEAVVAADPEVIIVSPHPGQPEPGALFHRWPVLSAVRSQRVVSVEADWLQRPGPRLALGLQALVKAFHGIDVSLEVAQ